jgi:ATP-dependent DNA ligase
MISDVLKDLRNTSKPLEKIKILKRYDREFPGVFRNFIYMSYDPFEHFNIKLTKKDLSSSDAEGSIMLRLNDIYEALDFCKNSFSHKQNREKLLPILVELHPQEREFIMGVTNKNWKAGVGEKLIVKAFPKLINTFQVQLANTYDPEKHKVAGRVWTYKLDGVRCIALRIKGEWKMFSRQGKEFLTVDHIKPYLEKMYQLDESKPDFWDGELYKHGLSFEEVQGLVTSYTKGTAEEIEYHYFVNGFAGSFFNQNIEGINYLSPYNDSDDSPWPLKCVQGGIVESEDEVEEIFQGAIEAGYEGIMLRDPNQSYDFKRSNALLKMKQSTKGSDEGEQISDCVVTDIVYGDFPYIENGRMKVEKDLLIKLWVQQEDGILCKVGTFKGFGLDDFRRYYTKNPWEILGMKVEIKHQGYGKNGRMRFPRLFRLRKDL